MVFRLDRDPDNMTFGSRLMVCDHSPPSLIIAILQNDVLAVQWRLPLVWVRSFRIWLRQNGFPEKRVLAPYLLNGKLLSARSSASEK